MKKQMLFCDLDASAKLLQIKWPWYINLTFNILELHSSREHCLCVFLVNEDFSVNVKQRLFF